MSKFLNNLYPESPEDFDLLDTDPGNRHDPSHPYYVEDADVEYFLLDKYGGCGCGWYNCTGCATPVVWFEFADVSVPPSPVPPSVLEPVQERKVEPEKPRADFYLGFFPSPGRPHIIQHISRARSREQGTSGLFAPC